MSARTPALIETAPCTAEPCGPAADNAEDWARPLIERQLAMLGRLAEAGLEIAVALERQATAADADAPPVARGDIALAYARVARAVRMTLALQSKLIKDLQALEAGAAQALADAEAEQDDVQLALEEDRKARIERIVGRVIKAERDDKDAVERLAAEASERLDDEDLYGDVLARPFSEVVADIRRDLGLHPDWGRLAQEPWAREELDSGEAGAPLAAMIAGRPPPLAVENALGPPLVRGARQGQRLGRLGGGDADGHHSDDGHHGEHGFGHGSLPRAGRGGARLLGSQSNPVGQRRQGPGRARLRAGGLTQLASLREYAPLPPRGGKGRDGGERAKAAGEVLEAVTPPALNPQGWCTHPLPCPSPIEGEG
jgi:hypothetical protein